MELNKKQPHNDHNDFCNLLWETPFFVLFKPPLTYMVSWILAACGSPVYDLEIH
jgi:hypothetical protein